MTWYNTLLVVLLEIASLILFNNQTPSLLTAAFGQAGPYFVIPLKSIVCSILIVSMSISMIIPNEWIPSVRRLSNTAFLIMASTPIFASLVMRHAEVFGVTLGPQIVYLGSIYPVTLLLGIAINQEIKHALSAPMAVRISLRAFSILAIVLLILFESDLALEIRNYSGLCKCHLALLIPIPIALSQLFRCKRQRQRFNLAFAILIYFILAIVSINLYPMCGIDNRLESPITISPRYKLYEQGESVTGWISVVRDNKYEARVMRSDMSLLGGFFEETKDSVYGVFHLMEMTRLTFPSRREYPLQCLQLGLGIGVSASALSRLGEVVDIVELDPLVYKYAVKWFDLKTDSAAKIYLEDAIKVIPKLPKNHYDIIMHDVFTGGFMASSLFTESFFHSLLGISKPEGIVGINVFGSLSDPVFASVYKTISKVFPYVRCFGDEWINETMRNFVIFGSRKKINFRNFEMEDYLRSSGRYDIFRKLADLEIPISELEKETKSKGRIIDESKKDRKFLAQQQIPCALDHWKVMRKMMDVEFWYSFLELK